MDEAEQPPAALRLAALYHWARATESLGEYMLQGTPGAIEQELDKHFESAARAAQLGGDYTLEMLLRWLHLCARTMVTGSVWWVARTVNSRVTGYVERMTKEHGLFELLPPQRVAIREQGLLDAASKAVVVDLPTSGGKTLLAEFRILQALNQFDADRGWVAYVAPTRALVAQITRRLRRHLEPAVRVEQLTGAVEIDAAEQDLLAGAPTAKPFDVLVTTPEKLQLVLRNGGIARPLALLVVDEAHNLEDEKRGLRIELLISTVKRECPHAAFLLLMPKVPNAEELANWLDPEAGKTVSLGTTAWRPNDRVIGLYSVVDAEGRKGDWRLQYESLITDLGTQQLAGTHPVGQTRPMPVPISGARGCLTLQTAAMCRSFCARGPVIAVAQKVPDVWSMARRLCATLEPLDPVPEDIRLVQQFLRTEVSNDYELVEMLSYGVGVHHAELSDEARSLIEWLAERRQLRALCATTTIAQGVNFPVSAVFMATYKYPYGIPMSHRAFWNLAGRAGRVGQDAVGVVGIAAGSDPDDVRRFVSDATGRLVSRLVGMVDELLALAEDQRLAAVFTEETWTDFRCYVAHLWNEKKNLDAVLAETEQLLRSTYGYGALRSGSDADKEKARLLLEATKAYARSLARHPENATLADATGFSPEGVSYALLGLSGLQRRLTTKDWEPHSIFGEHGSALPELFGIMMRLPQIGEDITKLTSSGLSKKRVADIARAWVAGKTIEEIAKEYFRNSNTTKSIGAACKAIYKTLANNGTWGLAALSKMPSAGINWESLDDDGRRQLNNLAAMLYHGVRTESGIMMRMNAVPRSVAEPLGREYEAARASASAGLAPRDFLRGLGDRDWEKARPRTGSMKGADYRRIWMVLAGEEGGPV